MIFCANPRSQYLSYRKEIDCAISNVLDSGRYILGPEVTAFENEFSSYTGVSYGIGVGNGTDAIRLALMSCGIGAGDEVITVSHTAVATIAGIELAGAIPVFVDIEPDYYTIDPSKIEAAITPRTKALIPVHIYGQAADMDPIMEIADKKGIKIIEDCAQAHGGTYNSRKLGSFGDIACFSFYPTKNLGAIGDGGIVVTDNLDLAQNARSLREYGWVERYVSHSRGLNSRLDELHAAVLRIKLRYLDDDNAKRQKLANIYRENLPSFDLVLPKVRTGNNHVYHQYVIRSKSRDRLLEFFKKSGIHLSIHYPTPVHKQPAYSAYDQTLGETERIASEILSLPIYPELSENEILHVVEIFQRFLKSI